MLTSASCLFLRPLQPTLNDSSSLASFLNITLFVVYSKHYHLRVIPYHYNLFNKVHFQKHSLTIILFLNVVCYVNVIAGYNIQRWMQQLHFLVKTVQLRLVCIYRLKR